MSQEKCTWELLVQLGGPRLDSPSWECFPCGLVACGRPDCPPPGSLLHWPHPTPDWGSTSHPTPQLWGDFQGLLCSFFHSSPALPGSLTEGVVCLFLFLFFSCLFCPFVFKDAAGQTGREGVCLPIWLRGPRRGCLGRAETSCNTVLPGWWPEVVCNSRGQVTPSTLASAPPSALPPHSHPTLPLPGVGQSFSKAVPTCVSEASLGRGLAALSACLRLSCCAPPSIKTSGASCCSSV